VHAISAKAQTRLRRGVLYCQINVPASLPQFESLYGCSKKLLNLFTDTVGRCSWPVRRADAISGHPSEELALNVEDLNVDCMDEDCESLDRYREDCGMEGLTELAKRVGAAFGDLALRPSVKDLQSL